MHWEIRDALRIVNGNVEEKRPQVDVGIDGWEGRVCKACRCKWDDASSDSTEGRKFPRAVEGRQLFSKQLRVTLHFDRYGMFCSEILHTRTHVQYADFRTRYNAQLDFSDSNDLLVHSQRGRAHGEAK
jgi:hypothetical protein